ncbi:hypothetical protein [Legionella clemsonensis]|uniref:Uncharacterized protein n=1 Tax=Legionella clemsonensis TaxID=1867846 RepID=A0A222P1W2_9GAMM|nr:hypothetical protein [Legionella clemsonensis]ASQ45848.1 hypothetical protein clem_06465 [Legionella clemsonensis]
MSGDYKRLSLEKLHGVKGLPIYSIRVNDTTRLLFTAYKGNICLLSEVLYHKYESNRFLKDPQVLKAFLVKMGASLHIKIEEKLGSSPFSEEELKNELGGSAEVAVDFVPLDYYKQQFKKSAVTVFESTKDDLLKNYAFYGEEVKDRIARKLLSV